MFQKILVCSDGSDRALNAAERAAELAKLLNAHVTLLHVCQIPSVHKPFSGAPMLEGPAVEQYVRDMHRAVAERTTPVFEQACVAYDVLEETGDPADTIARVANQQDYDLIVVGSRGVSVDKAESLGSVSHSVLQNASCPVLVVR
jgi:nucleotide-binding universal stress UspA family protein